MTEQLVELMVAADICEDGEDSGCGIVPGGGVDRAGRAIERLVITQRRQCGEDCDGCGVGARRRCGQGTPDLFEPGAPAQPAAGVARAVADAIVDAPRAPLGGGEDRKSVV